MDQSPLLIALMSGYALLLTAGVFELLWGRRA